ncbi:hypothetical protein KUE00_00405 [Erwiniaceae bacterium CMYE1]|nr:hypothetical protein [Erwinia phyllosphaerae]
MVDAGVNDISNGLWLSGVEGKYDIMLLPGRKVSVTKKSSFICGVDELETAGKVMLTIGYNF